MLIGILAGLITSALWGLTFVAPRAVAPFSAWDLAVARYCLFGLFCVLLMFNQRFRIGPMSPQRLITGLLLGAAGYGGYFVAVAFAVQLAGAAIPPVIVGTMPVFLAIIANFRERTIRWSALTLPLTVIAIGVAIVNIVTLRDASASNSDTVLLGIFASIVALVIWIVYGMVNAAVMRAPDAPDGLRWTGLQGIGAALGSLLLLPLTSLGSIESFSPAEQQRFIVWAVALAIAGSWLATWCWVVASRRLPLALAAQLIVAETVFGLTYGFMFEGRLPTLEESVGVVLQLVGVCFAIAIFSRRQQELTLAAEARQA